MIQAGFITFETELINVVAITVSYPALICGYIYLIQSSDLVNDAFCQAQKSVIEFDLFRLYGNNIYISVN